MILVFAERNCKMIRAVKLYKKDLLSLAAISTLLLGLVLVIKGNGNIFASTVDWPSQHSAFLEYFRQLFYENGKLLPSFAPNIGMGQNIFNFAYYGLLSPYVLIYFALPFLRPEAYLVTVSVGSALLSAMLFYVWMRKIGRGVERSLFAASMLVLSAPFIFHSHRHVMFVIYMPFLIGALFGAERYIQNNRPGLLVAMCVLIIFTSFYYSPMALACLLIVSVYRYIARGERTRKDIVVFGVKICLFILLAVALSAVLLLPTAYALFSGRSGTGTSSFELSYLLPQISVSELLYDPYSLGLTAIFPVSLLFGGFSSQKDTAFLSRALSAALFIPLVEWLANGTLYLDGKVLIPFLPAAIASVDELFSSLSSRKREGGGIYLILAVCALSGCASLLLLGGAWQLLLLFLFDICACAVFIHMSYVKGDFKPLTFYVLAFMLCVCLSVNFGRDTLVKTEDLKADCCAELSELSQIAKEREKNIVRLGINNGSLYHVNRVDSTEIYKTTVYSSAFNHYFNDCFYGLFNCEVRHRNSSIQNNSLNPLFNSFAAQKYMISRSSPGVGYTAVCGRGKYTLYENRDALPFARFYENTLSGELFSHLEYPVSAEALLKYAVCANGDNDVSALSAKRIELVCEEIGINKLKIESDGGTGFTVRAKKGAKLNLSLPENEYNILFIRFTLDPAQKEWAGDRSITVNGIKNKLTSAGARYHNGNYTFDYVLSSDTAIKELDISFTRGVYNISGLEFYTLDWDSISDTARSAVAFEADLKATKGDVICGKITAPKDGKLVFSIPYDRGFTVMTDGEQTEYEMANGGFICIDLTQGEHSVLLSYRAPMLNIGIAVSAAASCAFAVMTLWRAKKKK